MWSFLGSLIKGFLPLIPGAALWGILAYSSSTAASLPGGA